MIILRSVNENTMVEPMMSMILNIFISWPQSFLLQFSWFRGMEVVLFYYNIYYNVPKNQAGV